MIAQDGATRSAAPSRPPMLSVGLPVYNGAEHLESALKTLLAQTYGDFELIISDNASTDRTQEISEDYAARDSRICYLRVPENHGASWNFNRVAELAQAALFVWAAHDDEWHPSFFERCIGVLHRRPNTVATYSHYQLIDDRGNPFGDPLGMGCEGTSRRVRWNHVLRHWEVHPAIYGVMRTAVLRRTRGLLACRSSDLIFMSELLLHGELVVLPDVMHRKRMPPGRQYRTGEEVMFALSAQPRRPWVFHRFGVLQEELAGLRHAKLAKDEQRMLVRDAWMHYVTSSAWLYDAKTSAKYLLGKAGAWG